MQNLLEDLAEAKQRFGHAPDWSVQLSKCVSVLIGSVVSEENCGLKMQTALC